jgi:hypothetical protein
MNYIDGYILGIVACKVMREPPTQQFYSCEWYCWIHWLPGEVEVMLELTVGRSVGRSVSQYVKVSSPLWDLWPDITFCPMVVFWKFLSCLCGAPSLTRGRVYYLSFSACSNLSVCTSSIYVTCVLQFSNLYTIYTKLNSVPSQHSRLCSTTCYELKLPQ